MLTTPPIAWLPQITDWDPRTTSIRAMLPVSRLPKLKPPPGEDGSFSRMPSISATVWSASAPRMLTPVDVPMPPLRAKVTPGTVRSRSTTALLFRVSISSVAITVTDSPTSLSARGARLAVTTMSRSAVATARSGDLSGSAAASSAAAAGAARVAAAMMRAGAASAAARAARDTWDLVISLPAPGCPAPGGPETTTRADRRTHAGLDSPLRVSFLGKTHPPAPRAGPGQSRERRDGRSPDSPITASGRLPRTDVPVTLVAVSSRLTVAGTVPDLHRVPSSPRSHGEPSARLCRALAGLLSTGG